MMLDLVLHLHKIMLIRRTLNGILCSLTRSLATIVFQFTSERESMGNIHLQSLLAAQTPTRTHYVLDSLCVAGAFAFSN